MRIIECYVKGFGTICDAKYVFNPGLNMMLEGNGRGKSTLAAFIQAMLYGLSDTRKTSLDENDRKKYTPWSGGAFGGSLTVEARGKRYRIEREFGKRASEDTFRLLDAQTGRPSGDFGSDFGEELFGIDRDGFLRTVFLSEKALSEKNENKTVCAKLSGLSGVDADMSEVDGALAVLDEKRKEYYKKGGGGKIADVSARIGEVQYEIDRLMGIQASLPEREAELLRTEDEICRLSKEADELGKRLQDIELGERMRERDKRFADSLRADEERLAQLRGFFKNGTPTHDELDIYIAISASLADADRDGELSELRCRFDSKVSPEQIERIGKNKTTGARKRRRVGAGLTVIGAFGAIAGVMMKELSICFAAVFAVIGIAMMLAPAKGSGFDDATRELLTRLGYKCEPYAVEELKRDYARYEALLSKNAKDARGTAEMAENKKMLDEFLSKFPTRTDRPLSEIRSMLSALKSEEEAVARKRRDFIDGAGAFSGGALGKADMQDKHEQLLQKIRMLEAGRSIKKQAYELCLNDADRLGVLSVELSYLDLERARYSENLDVIKKTEKYLKEAGERLTARYLGSTKDGFDRYAKAIGGKETKTALDTSLTLTHYDGALARSTDSYSRGLRDLYALALRLALTDALFSDEGSFIILDDPFVSFDDEALARAKATLMALSKERQIIYFTCSSSRAISL